MAEAKISSSWKMQRGLMAALFLGFGIWGAYDAMVKYPDKQLAHDTFQKYMAEKDTDGWDKARRENDWPTQPPPLSTYDMPSQWIIMVLGLAIGSVSLITLLINLPKTQRSDDNGFSVGGPTIPYSAVTKIDKARWDKKALAAVHYEHDGQSGIAMIDDWKFQGAADVLKDIEQHSGKGEEESEA